MHIPTLISRKREGEELSAGEIHKLIEGYTSGEVPDYQMSPFPMAVFFKGMTSAETAALTRAMMESGLDTPPWTSKWSGRWNRG